MKNKTLAYFWKNLASKTDDLFESINPYITNSYFNRIFILLFSLIIITIKFIASDYRPGYSDPAGDAAFVIDGAMNIRNGNGYTFDSIWLFDEGDGLINEEISKPAYLYPPLMSILLSVLFLFSESIFTAILFQVSLFLIFVYFYYELISKMFSDKIAFFSTILLVSNPVLIFEVVSVPKTHILSLLLVVFFLYFNLVFKKDSKYIYLGIIAGFAYLTRDLNLLLLFSTILFFLINSRFDNIFKLISGFFVVTVAWFYRNFQHYETFNPRSTTTGYELAIFPTSRINGLNSEALLQYLYRFTFDISSPNLFYFLLPFLIFGILKHIREKNKHLLLIYSFIYLMFVLFYPLIDHDTGYRLLYILPFFILCLPFSISSFIMITKELSNSLSLKKNSLFAIMFIFFILVSISIIVKDEIGTKSQNSSIFDPLEDYEWSKENLNPGENVCLANRLPHRYHYFTGSNSITLPTNLDNQTFASFVEIYNISFFFIEVEEGNYKIDEGPYKALFSGVSTIQIDTVTLSLVNSQQSIYDSNNIYIYEVNN